MSVNDLADFLHARLVAFLRARLEEQHAALLRYRDGHDGPCRNYLGQQAEGYDENDSCHLHIEVAEATPYRDVAFGLAEVAAKRRLLDVTLPDLEQADRCIAGEWGSDDDLAGQLLRALAEPFAGHPEYQEGWRP